MIRGPPHCMPAHEHVLRVCLIVLLALTARTPVHAGTPLQPQIAPATVRMNVIDASDIRFSHLSISQGLSQTRVTRIVQDPQGFLWFVTQYGLNRFDGYRFKVFTPDPDNPSSICSIYVRSLFKDRSGTLWAGCNNTLDRYDPTREAFIHYRIDSRPMGLDITIKHISQDDVGVLWLSTTNGLYSFDPKSGKVTHLRHSPQVAWSLSSDDVYSSGEDRLGNFWVATAEGLDQLDRKTGRIRVHVPIQDPLEMAFYEDSTGTFWIFHGSANGLETLDRKRLLLTHYSFARQDVPNSPLTGVSAMLEDHTGTLWVGTHSDGLLKLDRRHNRFIRYRNDIADTDSLSEDRITTLTEDREGTIWVGLGATEPSYFASTPPSFQKLPFDSRNPANLDEKLVNAIYRDSEGFVWIGTTGAVNRLNPTTGQYDRFTVGEHGITSDVLSIAEDRTGTLWLGTSGQGLARFDRRTGRFRMYRHIDGDPSSPSDDTIPALFLDHDGRLWAGTMDGLDQVDPTTGRVVTYRHTVQGGGATYGSIAQDSHGDLWIADFFLGLLRFDPRSHQFHAFSRPQLGDLVQGNVVYVARSGTVWLGTQDGLAALDPATRVFTNYTEKDGMASDVVSCILEDSRGHLWMGTTQGLSRLNPRTHTFKNYSIADGLPDRDFTGWSACAKSPTGQMFFGGFAGAVAFDPDELTDSTYVPPVVLTAFNLFGVPVSVRPGTPLSKAIGFVNTLTLPHNENDFSFGFSALSFRSPSTNRYRYRLDGLDTGWHEVGSSLRVASYTTLPPGDYEFHVQGATIRGPWSEPGKVLRITILPPWWATWWFRIGAATALFLALWGIYRAHLGSLEHDYEIRLTERVRERTRIARELHDSLLQGFQGLMFRLQGVRELLPERPEDAVTALETAMQRGDDTIAHAREAVQDLRSPSLVGGALEESLEALWDELGSPGISFRLEARGHTHRLAPLLGDEVYVIAREAMRNAARHANAQNVAVEVEYGELNFSLRVRDDGDGIDHEILARGRRPGHWGLQGMRERAAHAGGRLKMWSELKAGTEVELAIPAAVAYGITIEGSSRGER